MAYENLCMYCFEDLEGHGICPHCGGDSHTAVPQIQLLPGTMVYHDRFLIGRALGQDASGIVYAALDTKRENKLRVREYLPRDCCERLNDGSVVPIAGKESEYDLGLKKLKASVEGEEDPRKRHFFFEQNGTGYIVQRKAAQPHEDDDSRDHEEREDDGGRRRGLIIALVAAIVVVAAAVVLFMLFRGPLSGNKDVTETPTLDPGSSVWTPLDSDSPTVTPYTSPTFAALVDPDLTWMDFTFEEVSATASSRAGNTTSVPRVTTATPKPTAVPKVTGDASSYTSIGGNSSQQDVRKLQRKLAELGWLSNRDVTGQYDDPTRRAVRDFQRYINQNYDPVTRLDVDGIAGPKTQQWLYQVNAVKPTATPRVTATPGPTPTPRARVTVDPDDDTVIDANSSNRQIRAMQLELIALGVMPDGSDSGNFDATTRSAVKRFQTRVNQLQGYEVLEVNGRMDALSMAFLDYYVDEWRLLQTGETPTPTPRTTPTPEAKVTPTPTPAATKYDAERDPSAIGPDSPAEAVKDVQQSLIAIGMLPEGSDDGNFGASTALAIRQFQDWVNRRRNEQTLTVNGEADPLTRAYLRYCIQNGMRPNADTVQIPTPTPTAVPQIDIDPDEEEVTIQRGSDREAIRKVQELLASVGLMSRRGIDGVYGNGTVNAVKAFQEYVNAHGGELEANGLADSATRRTLEYYVENNMTVHDDEEPVTPEPTAEPTAIPTPEPTAVPTEEPTPIPTENPVETARRLLTAVGALAADAGNDEAAMAQAIVDFQNWFNRQGNTRIEVTGRLDSGTLQMLELCASQGLRMMPEDISAADTADVEPETTDDEPVAEAVETEEAAPFAAHIEKLDITIAGQLYESGAMEVGEGNFSVSWAADGEVESYSVYVSDSLGNAVIAAEGVADTSFNVDAARMQPGEVYTVTIGAKPMGGTEDDIVWQTARFTKPAPAYVEPTPTPVPEANVPEVETPWINIEGIDNGAGLVEINENSLFIRWGANGARSYNVQITDSYGNVVASQSATSRTELSVIANRMQPGEIYTITVGAIPANGDVSAAKWNSARFTLPASAAYAVIETPAPTAEPAPVPTVAHVSRPAIDVGGMGYQQDGLQYMTDSTIILSWGAEGNVDAYIVFIENQSGERLNLGTTTDTSRTISASNLAAGVYTVYVGAIPGYGTEDDAQWGAVRFAIAAPEITPEPEPVYEAPEPEPTVEAYDYDYEYEQEPVEADYEATVSDGDSAGASSIDANSDASVVQQLQMRLYTQGVLAGDPEQGILDEATLEAVAEFQRRANEQYDAGLRVIDPSNPNSVIDADTLHWLSQGL